MRIFKSVLLIVLSLIICGSVQSAGLSTKIDHSKELKSIHENEGRKLHGLKKIYHERINWDRELNLNDAQKIYLKSVMKDSREKIEEQIKIIKEAHSQIDKIYQEDDEKIRKALTPQQQLKFDKILYRWQDAHGNKPKGDKPSAKRMRQ